MTSAWNKILLFIGGLTILFTLLFLLKKLEKERIVVRDFLTIQKSGRLNVAMEKNSLGFSFANEAIQGFNYEIVKAFADSMGLELNITIQNNFDSTLLGINKGHFDLIAECLPTVTSLQSHLTFVTPIYNSRLILITHKSDSVKIENIMDLSFLKKDSICVPIATPHLIRLENLSDEIAFSINIVKLKGKTHEDLVKMVSEQSIKYTVCDELQARMLQKKYPNINIETPIGFNQPYAWAVSTHSVELKEKINLFLQDFVHSSHYWDIYRRYF